MACVWDEATSSLQCDNADDYSAYIGGLSGGGSIGADQMNSGATSSTDWGSVLARGVSRLFDVAAVKSLPYGQTLAGQAQYQAQNNQRMMFMLLAGVALIVVLKRVG